jgi:hypothetical protein
MLLFEKSKRGHNNHCIMIMKVDSKDFGKNKVSPPNNGA